MSDEKDESAGCCHLANGSCGIGFLLRLLEARYDGLYQSLTRQTDITPRQFGVLMALSSRAR